MKRLLGIVAVLLLALGLGLGTWRLARREPPAAPPEDLSVPFAVQPAGPGQLIQYRDADVPLRALRWLPPMPGGTLAAQVLSQNDRQRVALFRDGRFTSFLLVLKPVGVNQGFWRFAVLADASLGPDGTLYLLYQAGDVGSTEPPLLVALDPASQQVRWTWRGTCARMALAPGPDPALFLYGGSSPVQRFALAGPPGGTAPVPKSIDLPPEVAGIDQLLPTGSWSFLAVHRDGLSAYRGKGGWTHTAAPAAPAVPCQDCKPCLALVGRTLWWQPAPGTLFKVRLDGTVVAPWNGQIPADDPFARDESLLRLAGADPDGGLWFMLATPVYAPPGGPVAPSPAGSSGGVSPAGAPAAATPDGMAAIGSPAGTAAVASPAGVTSAGSPAGSAAVASPAGVTSAGSPAGAAAGGLVPPGTAGGGEGAGTGSGPTGAAPDPNSDWRTYAGLGLDRLYRWNPARNELERVTLGRVWAGLLPPSGLAVPALDQGLAPAAGALLANDGRSAWWLPLGALPRERLPRAQAR